MKMKELKITIVIMLLFQLISIETNAQEEKNKQINYKNRITINAGRLILNEVRFGYERLLNNRHSLLAILGLQYPTSSTSFRSVPVGLGYLPNYYQVSQGIYLGAAYSYIVGPRSRTYISAEMYFNNNYYNYKFYHYCVGMDMDSYVSLESMNLRKTGLKVIIGRKIRIFSGSDIGLELDLFAGMGIQYRQEKLTVYKRLYGSCNWDYDELHELNTPEINTHENWYPTLHLGILIGVPFNVKWQ